MHSVNILGHFDFPKAVCHRSTLSEGSVSQTRLETLFILVQNGTFRILYCSCILLRVGQARETRTYNVTVRLVRTTIVAEEKKQVLNVMSVFLCPCLSYPACKSLLFCAVLSRMACLVVPYFSTLSCKRHDFWGKIIECEMCFDVLYNFCLKHFSL